MTPDFPKIDSKWFRFGEGVVQMNFSLPKTLKQVVKVEARDRGVSASALITESLMEILKESPAVKELDGRRV